MSRSRIERERDFHDHRYGDDQRRRARRFYDGSPSIAYYRERIGTVASGDEVLEFGCGRGSAAYALAEQGADVTGIDISPVAIESARAEAHDRGAHDVRFLEMNAESLEFPDDSFDLRCGSGILHHVDIDRAYRGGSCAAVGRQSRVRRATRSQPLHQPLPALTPKMRSVDEQPLRMAELARARDASEQVRTRFFQLLALGAVPLRHFSFFPRVMQRLVALDNLAFSRWPYLRRHAWTVVLELGNPRNFAN